MSRNVLWRTVKTVAHGFSKTLYEDLIGAAFLILAFFGPLLWGGSKLASFEESLWVLSVIFAYQWIRAIVIVWKEIKSETSLREVESGLYLPNAEKEKHFERDAAPAGFQVQLLGSTVILLMLISASLYSLHIVLVGLENPGQIASPRGGSLMAPSFAYSRPFKPAPALQQAPSAPPKTAADVAKAEICEEDNLKSCSAEQLCEMTLLLADKIDEVRTTLEGRLRRIREDIDGIERDPNLKTEEKNRNKTLLEHSGAYWVQMATQEYRDKYREDALKYREALIGKSRVPGTRDDSQLFLYQGPINTISFEILTKDLRRMVAAVKSSPKNQTRVWREKQCDALLGPQINPLSDPT
jgi:hypothetical protein